jgi:hypothetical protein
MIPATQCCRMQRARSRPATSCRPARRTGAARFCRTAPPRWPARPKGDAGACGNLPCCDRHGLCKLLAVMPSAVVRDLAGAGHMGPFTHAAMVNDLIMRHIIANESRLDIGQESVRAAA